MSTHSTLQQKPAWYRFGPAYCKTDNSYEMTGGLPAEAADEADSEKPEVRYKYSPAHQDAAVCCVPNAGRIYPCYVKSMWLKDDRGLTAALYGASVLETTVDGAVVRIVQETDYPFTHGVRMRMHLDRPATFELALRRPAWAERMMVRSRGARTDDSGWVRLAGTWNDGDMIGIRIETRPRVHRDLQGRRFVSYGPLVYALPLEGEEIPGREYEVPGFRDLRIASAAGSPAEFRLPDEPRFEVVPPEPGAAGWEWPKLRTAMLDPESDLEVEVLLVPMGGTVLRKVVS